MAVDKEKIRTKEAYKPAIERLKSMLCDSLAIKEGYTYKEYDEFFKSGSRKEYEHKYFRLYRWRLASSAILYYIYETEEYYDIMIETIWAVCNEYSWSLPNHSANETEESEIFDFIDLFAAETGHAMAEILHLMGDKIPPRLARRMRFEIERRIFRPFERKNFWWEEAKTNWAAVCAGCVGMTYLYEKKDAFDVVKECIYSALDSFLSGFSDEGVCFEGLDYWNYGFGYYIYFAEMLYEMTDGKEDLLHKEKVEKIAHFQQKVFIGGSIASFSDSSRDTTYLPGLTCYLAKTFRGVYIPEGATADWADNCGRFASAVRNILWLDDGIASSCENGWEYMKTAGWYFSRKEGFAFAAKAGHNDEQHNHNDIGSFIIADGGVQALADYGCGEYTGQYFDPETRYLYLCNSSRGHSVPEIDGIAQNDGREYEARDTKAAETSFSMDIAKAYAHPSLEKLERKFDITDTGVTVCDRYKFSDDKVHNICERFVSLEKPQMTKDGVKIGDFLLKSAAMPHIAEGTVKNHVTYRPETIYFTEYIGDFREFVLEIIKNK